MQSPEFQTLGFVTDNPSKLLASAVATGNVRGMQNVPGFDLIGAYTDPSGARLSLVRRKGREIEARPGLASSETHRAAVSRLGDALANASIILDEESSLELLVNVDDPTQYPERTAKDSNSFTLIQALQLGAICIRADVYENEEAFLAERPNDDVEWTSRAMASASIPGVGLLAPSELNARALVGFTVETAWKRTNELTGQEFWYGTGLSAVRVAFALPAKMDIEPGNVVLGTFTLTASSGLWDRS